MNSGIIIHIDNICKIMINFCKILTYSITLFKLHYRFDDDLTTVPPWSKSSWSHTDLPRLKRGRVAAQVTNCLQTQTHTHKKQKH